jgi:threonine dehydratase
VAVPGSTAPVKRRAMEELGATMLDGGASLSESEDVARSYAEETGARYVEDGDDRWLMAGAATVVGELLESAGDLDAVLVPVGGGNLVASALLAAALRAHRVEVIGVQSSAATGVTRSWLARRMLESRCDTFAAGLATARPGRASLAVLDAALRRMVVVDDDDLWNAIPVAYDALGLPVEAAGAAGIAALERFNEQITGRRVAVVVTGGRIDARELADALTGKRRHAVTPGRAPGRAGPV